ncbi:MAG: GNAT family N-acetyltransferase [Ruminococcus sp.]|nr:MAG: GNAT family N-acetyltransferase [Ruminococcus sp.]
MHNITIETERLILRPIATADAEAVFEWVSDERVAKIYVYNTYINAQQAVEWLKFIETNAKGYHFGLVRKSDGKLIGSGSIGRDSKGDGFWGFGYNFRYDCGAAVMRQRRSRQ